MKFYSVSRVKVEAFIMKKLFFCFVFLTLSLFAYSEELTSFMGIDFGTKKYECIKIMEKQGWKVDSQKDMNVDFSNEHGNYLGFETKSTILTFSQSQNKELLLAGGTIITSLSDKEKLTSLIMELQKKYEIKKHESFENNGLLGFILYTPAENRIVITLGDSFCSVTFGVNEKGLVEKKETSASSSPVGTWETNYVLFLENLQFFKDGSFVWVISGGKVDGMASGLYEIVKQNGKEFITFKSTSQRGNISLVLEKMEKFELLKLTNSELEIKTTKSDDLFMNTPISFKRK